MLADSSLYNPLNSSNVKLENEPKISDTNFETGTHAVSSKHESCKDDEMNPSDVELETEFPTDINFLRQLTIEIFYF